MKCFKLSDFGAASDGSVNCFEAVKQCFIKASMEKDSIVEIDPGEYLIDSFESIPLASHMRVYADGAIFRFPRDLGENKIRRMFYGENIEDFNWHGGHFEGYVYEPDKNDNNWPPVAYTGCICICATDGETVKDIHISNVTAKDVAGVVVNVEGCKEKRAQNIDVKDCQFIKSGRFMWDYGYLWQRIVFAHEYDEISVSNAMENIPKEHVSSEIKLNEDGSLYADFMPEALPEERDAVTFFGGELPSEIKRGKQYFVLNKGDENSLFISETENGEAIKILDMPKGVRLFRNMFYIFHDLYCPFDGVYKNKVTGKIPEDEKGSINIMYSENVTVSGCRISAVGDSMHINKSENVVFSNNQILGSRMGAFYIGFYCKNVTVTGNTVYGTNGSRTVSVELETEDITITGNTFSGGGRGCWFNRPKNVIISDNIFTGNTKKCTPDINTGRMCHVTGEFEKYPELYFTSNKKAEEYGPIIIRGNIFKTEKGASAAIALNPGGKDILIEGNIFKGDVLDIHVASGCEEPLMVNNKGLGNIIDQKFVNTANSR